MLECSEPTKRFEISDPRASLKLSLLLIPFFTTTKKKKEEEEDEEDRFHVSRDVAIRNVIEGNNTTFTRLYKENEKIYGK